MIRILQTILKIDLQLGKNASQTAIRTHLIRALTLMNTSIEINTCVYDSIKLHINFR